MHRIYENTTVYFVEVAVVFLNLFVGMFSVHVQSIECMHVVNLNNIIICILCIHYLLACTDTTIENPSVIGEFSFIASVLLGTCKFYAYIVISLLVAHNVIFPLYPIQPSRSWEGGRGGLCVSVVRS